MSVRSSQKYRLDWIKKKIEYPIIWFGWVESKFYARIEIGRIENNMQSHTISLMFIHFHFCRWSFGFPAYVFIWKISDTLNTIKIKRCTHYNIQHHNIFIAALPMLISFVYTVRCHTINSASVCM